MARQEPECHTGKEHVRGDDTHVDELLCETESRRDQRLGCNNL